MAERGVAPGVEDEGEGSKAEGSDPEAVDEHVKEDFDGEDTALELFESQSVRWWRKEEELTL